MQFCIVRKYFVCFLITVLVIVSCIVCAFADTPTPFFGSGVIKGNISSLGEVVIYVPIDSKGSWGTSDSGYLYNVSSKTINGVMYDSRGTKYNFSSSSFSFPRYRLATSQTAQYTDLYLRVSDNNVQVATADPPLFTMSELVPYILVSLMGVIVFCLMRYRH